MGWSIFVKTVQAWVMKLNMSSPAAALRPKPPPMVWLWKTTSSSSRPSLSATHRRAGRGDCTPAAACTLPSLRQIETLGVSIGAWARNGTK
jgi:hypothetical protein